MDLKQLEAVAQAMVSNSKGVLAAVESGGTINTRFDLIDTEATEESRRPYRETLFTTLGAAACCGGEILIDATIRQSATIELAA